MMKHARRNIDLTGKVRGESITMEKAARQGFCLGEANRFLDQRCIQVDASEFDAFFGKGCVCGEPTSRVADTAADIHDADRSGKAVRTQHGNDYTQDFVEPAAMVKLLGKALHFPMDRKHGAVYSNRVEDAVDRW